MPEFVFGATICCYESCDFDNILMGCKGEEEFLCIQEKVCLAAGEPQFGIGMIKEDGFMIKCGLPCCTYGLKVPSVLVKGGGQCLFVKSAASFPFDGDLVPGVVCAICAFRILPGPAGFMKPPKEGGAPGQEEMA